VINIKTPVHLGIIPDGNRRFAKNIMENPEKGHDWGMKKVASIMEWCRELGIKNVTFYTLSLENLERRPEMELKFLFILFKKELDEILEDKNHWVNKNRTKVNFLGETHMLPKDLQEKIDSVRKLTKDYSDWSMNLAIAYGGRQEIVNAVRNIVSEVSAGKLSPDKIDEAVIRHNLLTNGSPDPDLIIRTGGEKRISNFLTFQSTYSEFMFLDTLWPDLKKDEFMDAVNDFSERDRRFGK